VNTESQTADGAAQSAKLNVKVMVIDDSNAKITEHKPDIIFVDIMMPRLDGYQTCALIKNNQTFKATPVIMLSSKDSIFDRARGRIVGSEKYLTKPFSKEDLINAITTHVG
jgi:twitching motility two-component system response regulator PilG